MYIKDSMSQDVVAVQHWVLSGVRVHWWLLSMVVMVHESSTPLRPVTGPLSSGGPAPIFHLTSGDTIKCNNKDV